MIRLIPTSDYRFELYIPFIDGMEILNWYMKCSRKHLELPKIFHSLAKAVRHKRIRSTTFELDTAEMYALCKWLDSVVVQDRKYFKPDSLLRLVDLIRPHAHPVGPRWQYNPECRSAVDDLRNLYPEKDKLAKRPSAMEI